MSLVCLVVGSEEVLEEEVGGFTAIGAVEDEDFIILI